MGSIPGPRNYIEFPDGSVGQFNAVAREILAALATPESIIKLDVPVQNILEQVRQQRAEELNG